MPDGREELKREELNLERALDVLRSRAPWIVLCFLLAAGAAFVFSKQEAKQYTATASLVFSNNQLSQQVVGLQPAVSNNSAAEQATNVQLLQLGNTAAQTASLLGHGLTKMDIQNSLGISAVGTTSVVSVSATSTRPQLAAAIANTYSKQFVKGAQNRNRRDLDSALALVNKQLAKLSPQEQVGSAGLALQSRAQSLAVLAELRSGDVKLAEAASIPTSPSSPSVVRNTIIGALAGLLLGLGIAVLLERLDRRIREPKDLEAIYRLPLLGVVPESGGLSLSGLHKGAGLDTLPPGEAEVFRMIRAHLRYFNVDRDLRTVLVISPASGDGKTTVACHLAEAAATMGASTLLLEADLRAPTVAQQLAIEVGPGLSDVLAGTASMNHAIQTHQVGPAFGEAQTRHQIDVMAAGLILPPNPGELIESRAMRAVLERARSSYEFVLIDTSPLTVVSDAFPLLTLVDGIIVIGRIGRNRRDVAEHLHQTLVGVDAPLLGIVANGFKARGLSSYGYGGYGGYGYAAPPAELPKAGGLDPTNVVT